MRDRSEGLSGRVLVLVLLAVACARPAPPPEPAPFSSAIDSVTSVDITDGVTYTRTWDATGPWAVHVLNVDRQRCRPVFRARKAGPSLSGRATTSELGAGALAAINADFFELPGGRPVGAHVSDGEILIGPGRRPVLAITASGPVQGRASIQGWVARGADTIPLLQVNRRTDDTTGRPGPLLLTHAAGIEPNARALRIRTITGGTGWGRGVVADPMQTTASLRPAELAIENADSWVARRSAGDTVEWSVRLLVENSTEPVVEAVGGFPTLLQGGHAVLSAQPGVRPAFGENRHPRTAVAWNESSIFLVVVDGRQTPWSDGMSLPELSNLLLRLGARDGLNLDGGGSSAMVIRGETVNRPSDAEGERTVGNALVLERCRQAGRSAASEPPR